MALRLVIFDKSGALCRQLDSLALDFECGTLADLYIRSEKIRLKPGQLSLQANHHTDVILLCYESWQQLQRENGTLLAQFHIIVACDGVTVGVANKQHSSDHVTFCHVQDINRHTIHCYSVIAVQHLWMQQLAHESHCYREMVDSCPDYVFIRDRQHRIVFANAALAELHELAPAAMIGQTYADLTGDIEGGQKVAIEDREIFESGKPFYKHEDFYQDESGATQWNRVTKKRISSHDGADHLILGVATDLTEWKKNEEQLQESEARFRDLYLREQVLGKISDVLSSNENESLLLQEVAGLIPKLFNSSHGGIIDCDSATLLKVKTENGREDTVTVMEALLFEGKNHGVFTTTNNDSLIAARIHSDYERKEILFALKNSSFKPFELQDAELLATVSNQCFLTITKIDLHKKIQYQAFHDSLSGLPNRLSFEHHLDTTIVECSASGSPFCVLFLDLDGFKVINDTYGHLIGDEVLRITSLRLTAAVGTDGFLARMGGDEFSIVLHYCLTRSEAEIFATEVLNVIHREIPIDSNRFSISASIGISIFPEDGEELSELMRRADSAMYYAKSTYDKKVAFFNKEIEQREQRRQRLETDLARALSADELELFYQPQYDLNNGCICGVEALARWHHKTLGYISPAEFITVAEQSQLIVALGDWVINTALQQARLWQNKGFSVTTSINISAKQCELNDFSQKMLAKVKSINLDASGIQVEVTESALMKDLDKVSEHLQQLRNVGVAVSIDDFGTGYSSLGYLQELPLDELKIDGSFVNSLNTDHPESSLIGVITQMAHGLGLRTVVEGVETEEQVIVTRQLGCDIAQGWYFAKAMPAEQVTELLENSPKITLGNYRKAA